MFISIKVSLIKLLLINIFFFLFCTTSYYNLVCNYYKRGIKYGTRKSKNMLYLPRGELFYRYTRKSILFEIMKFEPCVLCWYQRIFMYPFVLWLGIAVVKRLSHRKLFFTNRKYWRLYFFISLCNSKVAAFSAAGAACGRTMYGRIHKLVRLCDNPVLALIGFITIAVCSFIVIKTNKEMKE